MSNQLLLKMRSELQNINLIKSVSKAKEGHVQNLKFFTVIRNAQLSDADQIWDILHCERQNCSKKYIIENINDFLLLIFEGKLIAILHYSTDSNTFIIKSAAVHPMYPEKVISNSLNNLLLGLITNK